MCHGWNSKWDFLSIKFSKKSLMSHFDKNKNTYLTVAAWNNSLFELLKIMNLFLLLWLTPRTFQETKLGGLKLLKLFFPLETYFDADELSVLLFLQRKFPSKIIQLLCISLLPLNRNCTKRTLLSGSNCPARYPSVCNKEKTSAAPTAALVTLLSIVGVKNVYNLFCVLRLAPVRVRLKVMWLSHKQLHVQLDKLKVSVYSWEINTIASASRDCNWQKNDAIVLGNQLMELSISLNW